MSTVPEKMCGPHDSENGSPSGVQSVLRSSIYKLGGGFLWPISYETRSGDDQGIWSNFYMFGL